MNKLTLAKNKLPFEIYSQTFWDLQIDGQFLSQILDLHDKSQKFRELAPTWADFLLDERDQQTVWEKIEISKSSNVIIPLLICPDDGDFSCTTLVVQSEYVSGNINWLKFGLSIDDKFNQVNWLTGFPNFAFEMSNYSNIFDDLRTKLYEK